MRPQQPFTAPAGTDCKAGAPRASRRVSETGDPLVENLVGQWEIINIKGHSK